MTGLACPLLLVVCCALAVPAGAARIEIEVETPQVDEAIESETSFVHVSGIAKAVGTTGAFDIVLVIDRSQSTVEPSGADIDRDGKVSQHWNTPDSVYHAQSLAARMFFQMIADLRGERSGRSDIRLGLVTFAGEREQNAPEGAHLKVRRLTLGDIDLKAEAEHDAILEAPLSDDFENLYRELARTALYQRQNRLGTYTNFVAGLGRGMLELEEHGREEAGKLIMLLTDGRATLPYNPYVGEDLALQLARRAGKTGIRINVFGIGRIANLPKVKPVLQRIASTTGGVHTSVYEPARIIEKLRKRPIAHVRAGNIRSWGRSCASRRRGALRNMVLNVVFNLDGSFSGFVNASEGENCIEIVVETENGKRHGKQVPIQFQYPEHFVERFSDSLMLEMEQVREHYRRTPSIVTADEVGKPDERPRAGPEAQQPPDHGVRNPSTLESEEERERNGRTARRTLHIEVERSETRKRRESPLPLLTED
jgi:hypothetical protein